MQVLYASAVDFVLVMIEKILHSGRRSALLLLLAPFLTCTSICRGPSFIELSLEPLPGCSCLSDSVECEQVY